MNKRITIAIAAIALTLASCKKENEEFTPGTNVWVVNSIVDMPGAKVITGNNSAVLGFNGNRLFSLERKSAAFDITDAVSSATVYNSSINLKSAAYSIFLTGQSPTSEVIIKEETDFPFIAIDKIFTAEDSVVNVRFINLSPNSVPLKIKVSTATTNESDALAYKDITTWRPFKAGPAATTTHSIQIRNAATDALITTYTFAANATKRFKNVTLMIRGLMGTTSGVNAFGVTEVNYF